MRRDQAREQARKKAEADVVYTPDWCARDMVRHFRPEGVVLDPCRGKGAFTPYLPEGHLWCEIAEGRDFYLFHDRVDWVIGNPPYSHTRRWLLHSYKIARDVCYLVPFRNVTSGYGLLEEMRNYGWMRAVRVYGTGNLLGFPMGNCIVAIHVQKGYRGQTAFSFYKESRPGPRGFFPDL